MRRDVDDRLRTRFDSHRIVQRLHDVPPHEVFEVRVDGRRAVYKGDTGPTGAAGLEGRVIDYVGDRTTVPVPEPLAVGDDYFVVAWHPGAPAPGAENRATHTWARAAGRCLATLHDETGPDLDGFGEFRPRDGGLATAGRDEWRRAAIAYVGRRRPVLAEHGHADLVEAVVGFLEDHPGVFDGAGGPVCCHGWATPAHVGVVEGRAACVVDFEHAIAAPAEFDYWRTVLPTFGGDADRRLAAFRDGYEAVRALPAGLERRRPLYVVLNECYYLESLYVQDRHGSAETTERANRLRAGISRRLDELR